MPWGGNSSQRAIANGRQKNSKTLPSVQACFGRRGDTITRERGSNVTRSYTAAEEEETRTRTRPTASTRRTRRQRVRPVLSQMRERIATAKKYVEQCTKIAGFLRQAVARDAVGKAVVKGAIGVTGAMLLPPK